MKTRNIKLFNRTIPLIPLIVVLVVGSVVVGYSVTNGFLTIIPHPVQQETYVQTDNIIIGEIVDYIWGGVTLEGEVNGNGAFGLGKPISVSLLIKSLRPDFKVTDDYSVTIGTDVVLSGAFTDLEMGTDYTDSGTWTPMTVGSVSVTLEIANMVWTNEVVFTSVDFTSSSHPDSSYTEYTGEGPLELVGHTIPVSVGSGTTVDFEYTVKSAAIDGSPSNYINGWLWEVKYKAVGEETEWTVATSGKIFDYAVHLDFGDEWTVTGLSFTAPAPGDYDLLINCWNVHDDDPGPVP